MPVSADIYAQNPLVDPNAQNLNQVEALMRMKQSPAEAVDVGRSPVLNQAVQQAAGVVPQVGPTVEAARQLAKMRGGMPGTTAAMDMLAGQAYTPRY